MSDPSRLGWVWRRRGEAGYELTRWDAHRNAGHDFNGRSSGAGALSVWTHHLKEFEYLPEHTAGPYTGRAARVSAGIETWEIHNYMGKHNMTMPVPGGDTVGLFGGWIAGGGHHFLSSMYGQGADQVLEFKVVTADGRYRTVTPFQNGDLFFAMLGGGGGKLSSCTGAWGEIGRADRALIRHLRHPHLGAGQGVPPDTDYRRDAGV